MNTYPRYDSTSEVVTAVRSRPDVLPFARLVGSWVWCEFPDKPNAETRTFLKETGFRWNKERGAWQHSCGVESVKARNYDPRGKYGMVPLDEKGTAA